MSQISERSVAMKRLPFILATLIPCTFLSCAEPGPQVSDVGKIQEPVDNPEPAATQPEENKEAEPNVMTADSYNELTKEETRILVHKGTEFAGTGALLHNKEKGTYICRRCNAALYGSEHKFESGCGWPSFDDEIEGAVRRQVDADGSGRVEILCQNCDGHLGHVFEGERFTAKNTRHCVNSVSMKFVKEGDEMPPMIKLNDSE